MRRLAVALCALFLSVGVALGNPELSQAAVPPPPCPSGSTFIWCIHECPVTPLEDVCLFLAYNPPNCRVVAPFCFDSGLSCDGGYNDVWLWCPYEFAL